jgi:DNA-binding NtrC family response regulator
MSTNWDVLVIDDEPVVRDAIRLVLEEQGLRVALVPDAETALLNRALDTCRLVICDVMLPGASGIEVVRVIRARRPQVPIVLITGFATAEVAARSTEAGATAFLAKPFDDTELLDLVRRVLEPTDVAGEERRS